MPSVAVRPAVSLPIKPLDAEISVSDKGQGRISQTADDLDLFMVSER